MPRYIAFLPAINVGGHNVKMAQLRTLFEQLECNLRCAGHNAQCHYDQKAGCKVPRRAVTCSFF